MGRDGTIAAMKEPRLLLFKSHVDAYVRKDGTVVSAHDNGRIHRHLTKEEAGKALGDAWWGGKNKDQKRIELNHTSNDDGSGYVEADVPLHKVKPNEAGDLYDGTANAARVKDYVGKKITAPVHLGYSARVAKNGKHAAVIDGGHRVSAARLRGDTHVRAIMQRSHYDRLIERND